MRLSALLLITAATFVIVVKSQFTCYNPDTSESVEGVCIPRSSSKGEKGDVGPPGHPGPVGVGEKGVKGKKGKKGEKGESPQEIDVQEIWNAMNTANRNIQELTESKEQLIAKNNKLEENFSRLEAENSDLLTKVHNNTAQLEHRSSTVTETVVNNDARNCQELLTERSTSSGVYEIRDPSGGRGMIEVYCDMLTEGGGWTVLQKRNSGSVDFYQGWQQYKAGFGDVSTEYWLGLENIHHLTSGRTMKLRVVLKDFDDSEVYAEYSSFSVAPSSDNYRLSISGYSGTAGDSLAFHNGRPFSTKDADHDAWIRGNCATRHHGAWWYGYCGFSNLNGRYFTSARSGVDGVVWHYWKNSPVSLKETKMMIRV